MKQMMILSMLLAAACASTRSVPPALIVAHGDLSRLTGVWQGRIVSDDASIAGHVEFRVTSRGFLTFEGDLRDGEIDGIVWQRVAYEWQNAGSFSARREGAVQ